MKIIHCIPFKMQVSNGIQASAWRLAEAQSCLGAEVSILSLGRKPNDDEVQSAAASGVRLVGVNKRLLSSLSTYEIISQEMQNRHRLVVHLHSAFIPQHSLLGYYLHSIKIPYCIKLGGTLLPEDLARKSIRKHLYLAAIENGYLRRAAALIAVSRREQLDLQHQFPTQCVELLPNAVIQPAPIRHSSTLSSGPARGFFMGKKDVLHKGIDRLFDVSNQGALHLDLYMIQHAQTHLNTDFERLCLQGIPANLRVLPPVYGEDKQTVLQSYDYYIHASRWEVFGNSILEAMLAAKPVILSRECDLAADVEAHSLGMVVNFDAFDAGSRIRAFIDNPIAMAQAGARAKAWALEHSGPEKVAAKSLKIYESMCKKSPSR